MEVSLKNYLKSDEENATLAIRSALADCGDGDTLLLGGGILHCYPEGAEVRHYHISNNSAGEKPIAFPLIAKKNLTVDGEGAEIIFHGRILPFAIDHSENVTVKDLSIDCSSVRYSQAEIIEADRYKTVLKFSGEFGCKVDEDGLFCFFSRSDGWERHVPTGLTMEFESSERYPRPYPSSTKPAYFPYCGPKRDHGFLASMYKDVMLEQLSDDTIAMHGSLGFEHKVGNMLVTTHATREFPGFFINESTATTLSDIRIYYISGMGLLGQLSDGIKLERVIAEPRDGSGRVLSVNADATHFVNCRGKLELADCKFVSMMDDACNIHGIYALCRKVEGNKLTVGFGHPQQKGIKLCRDGDRIAVIDLKSADTIATRTVLSSTMVNEDEYVLELDESVPEPKELWAIENLSTAPEIHVHGCECGLNRPRGMLVASRSKILIEKSKFYNMYQGINIACELKNWFESGPTHDITIRDCDFENSAYAGGCAITAVPHLYEQTPRDFFLGRIVIENNRFTQSGKRLMYIDLASEVIVSGNEFICDSSLPDHGAYGESGMKITNCGKIEIRE